MEKSLILKQRAKFHNVLKEYNCARVFTPTSGQRHTQWTKGREEAAKSGVRVLGDDTPRGLIDNFVGTPTSME